MRTNQLLSKPETQWKGMTLDELRYARIINEMRIVMATEKLSNSTKGVLNGNVMKSRSSSMVGRMLGALSWLDYGLIALRLSSKLSKIIKHKKNK